MSTQNNTDTYIWANLQVRLSIQTGSCNMTWTIESIWGQKHQICRENFIFGYTDNITHLWGIRREGITDTLKGKDLFWFCSRGMAYLTFYAVFEM